MAEEKVVAEKAGSKDAKATADVKAVKKQKAQAVVPPLAKVNIPAKPKDSDDSAVTTEETDAEIKAETDIIPEVKGDVVNEVEDEKQLLQKLKEGKEKKRRPFEEEFKETIWTPRTALGKKVYNGEITTLHDVIADSVPIKEVGLVDKLLPNLQEEILDVGRVQRVTDSGRRMRFRVVAAVGNGDGYIGVGEAKGKEAGPTIRKSIERAKLNIREIKRGCGSWECGCGTSHTVPFKIRGKAGSVTVDLVPAPRGVGIVSGKIAKTVLTLAGVRDVWVLTEGHTRSGINFAHAVINALENTNYVKLKAGEAERLKIVTGSAKPTQPAGQEVSE
jgi:small subunit ribosomal protein S5